MKFIEFYRQTSRILLTTLLLLFTGCQSTVYLMEGQGELSPDRTPAVSERYASVVLGVVELSDPVSAPCQTAVDRVDMKMDLIDSIIHFWIGGIYTTRSVSVYCVGE